MQLAEMLSSGADTTNQDVTVSQAVIERANRGGLYELGESYMRGEWETTNLMQLLFQLITADNRLPVTFKKFSPRLIGSLIKDRVMNLQVGRRAFEVGERHYDLGNDLFATMLDQSSMSYTCGYWRNARNLDEAQINKIDLLCKKLKLKPGMRVLDIGCGWANFAYHAAKNYGVSVVGLTVSKEQAALGRERCKGLPVEILIQDYQTFSGTFDRVVSIEMIEAVGRKNIPTFFSMVERCLTERGLFALQVISAETFSLRSNAALDQFIMWLQYRIFPNGWIPSFPSLIDPARGDLVVEDLHNFSADYATTLHSWALNFEQGWPSLKDKYGEEFRRMWLYYLNGCEALFTARMVQLYQIVYSKGGIPGGYEAVR
ncbi:MAG: cyclopropane fatty acyl phospholipid synthase [Pseudomonadota bacterium]